MNEFDLGKAGRLLRRDAYLVPASSHEIRLFCKVRNELARLDAFIAYYRNLGVDRFFFIDNESTDGTTERLLESGSDIHVYTATGNMRSAYAGLLWLQPLLHLHGDGRWILVVDADELLIFDNFEQSGLRSLCEQMTFRRETAMFCLLLDMYAGAESPMAENAALPFVSVCPYFDPKGYRRAPCYFNPTGEEPTLVGGPRLRLFYPDFVHDTPSKRLQRRLMRLRGRLAARLGGNGQDAQVLSPPIVNKVPLMHWTPNLSLSAGAHYLGGSARLSATTGVLLHFKFIEGFERRVVEEASRQVYSDAGEYRRYLDAITRAERMAFVHEQSTHYVNSDQLRRLGLIQPIDRDRFAVSRSHLLRSIA